MIGNIASILVMGLLVFGGVLTISKDGSVALSFAMAAGLFALRISLQLHEIREAIEKRNQSPQPTTTPPKEGVVP